MTVKRESSGRRYHPPSKLVLVFNGAYTLIDIIRSVRTAAEQHHLSPQVISMACSGERVLAGCYYYRHIHSDVNVVVSDIGNLDLKDYDRMCGYERQYISVREMAQKKRALKYGRIKNIK